MRFKRKSTLQRMLDTLSDSLDTATDAAPSLPKKLNPGSAAAALPKLKSGNAGKAGLIAAGRVAGLTAGSAAVSALRRRLDGGRADS